MKLGQWTNLFCSQCKQPRKASKWWCPCGRPWCTCLVHHEEGFRCQALPRVFKPKRRNRPPPELGSRPQRRPPHPPHKRIGEDLGQHTDCLRVEHRALQSKGPVANSVVTDGVTGVLSQNGPHPKRSRSSISPQPLQATCERTSGKRKQIQRAEIATTNRLVAHILAKKARLAAKLGEATARPPE